MESKEKLKALKEFIGSWCDNITKEYRQKINKDIEIIEKDLELLDILKNKSYIIWKEKGQLYCGRYGDIEIPLDKDDFESEEDFNKVMEGVTND